MNGKYTVNDFLTDNNLHFDNIELLSMALIHPSYSQEQSGCTKNNQRLEFLGDAVLDFVVAEYLYKNYVDKSEGDLTQIRARVVCETALLGVAKEIDVGRYLLLGKGEDMTGGRTRKSILADTIEAIIGAVYLDQGLEAARTFILIHLEEAIKETAKGDYQDYKSKLQEFVQAKSKENVRYRIIEESGPAHAKVFVAGVFFKDKILASGQGRSKKEAEQSAAEKVLIDSALLKKLDQDGER